MSLPRYWDGRVRMVTSVRKLRSEHGTVLRLETLDCGHTKIPSFTNAGAGPHNYRVCFECPGIGHGA